MFNCFRKDVLGNHYLIRGDHSSGSIKLFLRSLFCFKGAVGLIHCNEKSFDVFYDGRKWLFKDGEEVVAYTKFMRFGLRVDLIYEKECYVFKRGKINPNTERLTSKNKSITFVRGGALGGVVKIDCEEDCFEVALISLWLKKLWERQA